MLPYQEQYIANMKEIASLSDFYAFPASDFSAWYEAQQNANKRIEVLRDINISLLEENLFPRLDDLHNAGENDIADLTAFAGALMDWNVNLDIGVYIQIHDALLSLARIRRDRDALIRELYLLGMGLYYMRRNIQGLSHEQTHPWDFQNEMVFTEAASYLKYFENIEHEETKGYIVRAQANIAIATHDLKRRIAAGARVLQMSADPYYRELAPNLPWDVFRRKTHQQMSSNRSVFSKGNLSPEELSLVLESCHEVFVPEEVNKNPNVRWIWPYYEMEYSLGFVDLAATFSRLEELILASPYNSYDVSGLYSNVQLAIYYGRLMSRNPVQGGTAAHVSFLAMAYEKMLHTMMTIPPDRVNDLLLYNIALIITDYYEIPGVPTYRDLTAKLMQRFAGRLYIRSRRVGDLLVCLCDAIISREPDFFDDIPFIKEESDPGKKRTLVLSYAADCGLYHDFGLIKLHFERTELSRNLFENEYQMQKLHTLSGHDDLAARPSTAIFADIALGHHSWYNAGPESFPASYIRNTSCFRQMTDAVAIAAYMIDHAAEDIAALIRDVIRQEHRRFSPLITVYLSDRNLASRLETILKRPEETYYREMYEQITAL